MTADRIFLITSVVIGCVLFVPLSLILFAPEVFAAVDGVDGGTISVVDPGVRQWAFAAAAIAAGLSTLGAGYAVAIVGSAAVGALAEKPELLGRLLIFVGLAEGIAIYGLIVAILILNQVQ